MEDQAARDRALVGAALRGDGRAFGELVGRHQRLVAAAAWRSGIGPAEIEDVVSEVFLKAYQNLHRYRPEHAFSSWLYRLALNHAIDHTRRARRERGRTEMPEQIVDPRPGAARATEAREEAGLVREALRRLKPRYREVLLLVYVEGMKIDEVARILQLPSGTVKTRLMRGRAALGRDLLRRHPGYFGG